MNKVNDLQPVWTNFGIRPKDGFLYCSSCAYTLPAKAFHKTDHEADEPLCKTCKKSKRVHERKVAKINRLSRLTDQS